ncbi:MAG TPA: very short patch repair endonuclease [Caulobacteraceae bacterium]|jgi:DNA mismatch endonuclease (patch repair protein)
MPHEAIQCPKGQGGDLARWPDVDPSRSDLMARIRSTDTAPEMCVRRAFHARGYRFRLHRRDLPGRPDLVFPRLRLVVFVHGCFWHQHVGCRIASDPKTRREYWVPKLARNVARDQANAAKLSEMGWRTATIWECETRRIASLENAVSCALNVQSSLAREPAAVCPGHTP